MMMCGTPYFDLRIREQPKEVNTYQNLSQSYVVKGLFKLGIISEGLSPLNSGIACKLEGGYRHIFWRPNCL